MSAPWKRVVLKFSGEALAGPEGRDVLDFGTVARFAAEIAEMRSELGVDIALVIGGGNVWRGATGAGAGMDRATADYMGMLATVFNALAFQDALERIGQPTRVQTAIEMNRVAEPYIRRKAMRHLEQGRVVILAGGTGGPFFTTDTAAALRAAEIGADVLLKGTHGGVDGVYTADPKIDSSAEKLDDVSFKEAIEKELRVMDLTALTLCKENNLPILVFDVMGEGNIGKALRGEQIGTLVK